MSKHTEGPWKTTDGCCTVVTVDRNGWEIADIRPDVPEFAANSCLIAAAPDLLAALKIALSRMEQDIVQIDGEWGYGFKLDEIVEKYPDGDDVKAILAARSAIAIATQP